MDTKEKWISEKNVFLKKSGTWTDLWLGFCWLCKKRAIEGGSVQKEKNINYKYPPFQWRKGKLSELFCPSGPHSIHRTRGCRLCPNLNLRHFDCSKDRKSSVDQHLTCYCCPKTFDLWAITETCSLNRRWLGRFYCSLFARSAES